MLSLIKISNIYVEDLFWWYYKNIIEQCGDGAGVIVCANYKETAQYFLSWFKKSIRNNIKYNDNGFYHPMHEYDNIISFHDMNESFMFSNSIVELFEGEYVFLIEEDCRCYPISNSDFIIKKI